ncbi:hypothetical protein B0H14DRAFT_3166403 [Mycena olivaceomarginata]|nr:hypothetical protein B0H14DRAFT_3166403 [Mycena olivaceomarginata]
MTTTIQGASQGDQSRMTQKWIGDGVAVARAQVNKILAVGKAREVAGHIAACFCVVNYGWGRDGSSPLGGAAAIACVYMGSSSAAARGSDKQLRQATSNKQQAVSEAAQVGDACASSEWCKAVVGSDTAQAVAGSGAAQARVAVAVAGSGAAQARVAVAVAGSGAVQARVAVACSGSACSAVSAPVAGAGSRNSAGRARVVSVQAHTGDCAADSSCGQTMEVKSRRRSCIHQGGSNNPPNPHLQAASPRGRSATSGLRGPSGHGGSVDTPKFVWRRTPVPIFLKEGSSWNPQALGGAVADTDNLIRRRGAIEDSSIDVSEKKKKKPATQRSALEELLRTVGGDNFGGTEAKRSRL